MPQGFPLFSLAGKKEIVFPHISENRPQDSVRWLPLRITALAVTRH
jgi:hypothetical protein